MERIGEDLGSDRHPVSREGDSSSAGLTLRIVLETEICAKYVAAEYRSRARCAPVILEFRKTLLGADSQRLKLFPQREKGGYLARQENQARYFGAEQKKIHLPSIIPWRSKH